MYTMAVFIHNCDLFADIKEKSGYFRNKPKVQLGMLKVF